MKNARDMLREEFERSYKTAEPEVDAQEVGKEDAGVPTRKKGGAARVSKVRRSIMS